MRRVMTIWVMGTLLAGPAHGATYVVNPDGTSDFPTIQAAVDVAVNGDIIELGNGIFSGDGNRDVSYRGEAITIRSRGGPEVCTIDCQGSAAEPHRAFAFMTGEGPETVLEGVGVTGGHTEQGAGVYCGNASPTILDCVFAANTAGGWGAGAALFCYGPTLPSIVGCTFLDNEAPYGGAVQACAGTIQFTRCTFAGNHGDVGGALYI
jgi:hypothetical protein